MVAPSALMAQKEITVAVLHANVGQYFELKWAGAAYEAKQLGVKAVYYNAGGYQNLDKQIAQIEDCIQAKVDAIVIHPCSSTGVVPAVEKAIKAGIHVVNENVNIQSDLIKARVMKDSNGIGLMVGTFIADRLNGKGKVILLPGPPGHDQAMDQYNGAKAYLAKYPNIKIVGEQWTSSDSAAAMKAMEDLLTAAPDVNAVYAFADLVAIGAVQALRAAGKKPGQVHVISMDFDPECQKLLRQGWISALIPCETVTMGRLSVSTAVKMARGEKVPPVSYIMHTLVTKDSIDNFDQSALVLPK